MQSLTAYYIDDGLRTNVFVLEPNIVGTDGDYKFTLLEPVDQPVPTITLSFAGIKAEGPITEIKVGSSLLISAVTAGDNVNASQGFVGISNNIMNDGEVIQYEFGAVGGNADDLFINPADHFVVNNVSLELKDTGSGNDGFDWTAYKWVDVNNVMTFVQVGSGSQVVPDGANASAPIYVDGGFDTIRIDMNDGAFKVGGLTYDSLGDAQDITLNFDYSGADADGDGFSGSFDVTITSGDGISSTGQIYSGTDGDDNLSGGSGSDNLFGYVGDDLLSGGDQNDFLVGGGGSDTMTGGNGSDNFHYGVDDLDGSLNEQITDFRYGVDGDVLDLSELFGTKSVNSLVEDGNLDIDPVDADTVRVVIDADGSTGGNDNVIIHVDLSGGTLDSGSNIIDTMLDNNIKTEMP